MKVLVYHGPGERAWEETPDPIIQDADDAVVRVDAVTICGTCRCCRDGRYCGARRSNR
jgi:alcohol dehydrogenase